MADGLDALERWFQEVVTHPLGVAEGARAARAVLPRALDEVCLPSERLAASERIGIYADAYVLRLLEVLQQDFPALVAFLGPAASDRLLREYVARHPSRHKNLNRLGAGLPRFLAEEATDVVRRPFAAELARLERDVQEVFDAPRAETLAEDELLAIAPEAWGELRLSLVPALRLLAFEHPTNAWYQAWRDEERAPEPPAPGASWLVLYRRDWRVWRAALGPEQHALLSALGAGETLGGALERLASEPGFALERVGPALAEWFREWSGLGFFAALDGAR